MSFYLDTNAIYVFIFADAHSTRIDQWLARQSAPVLVGDWDKAEFYALVWRRVRFRRRMRYIWRAPPTAAMSSSRSMLDSLTPPVRVSILWKYPRLRGSAKIEPLDRLEIFHSSSSRLVAPGARS